MYNSYLALFLLLHCIFKDVSCEVDKIHTMLLSLNEAGFVSNDNILWHQYCSAINEKIEYSEPYILSMKFVNLLLQKTYHYRHNATILRFYYIKIPIAC